MKGCRRLQLLSVLPEATERLPPPARGNLGGVSGRACPAQPHCPGAQARALPPTCAPRAGQQPFMAGDGLEDRSFSAQRRPVLPRDRPHSSALVGFEPQREASGRLSLEMGKRHHPDTFLKWAWKMFQRRFVFASGLLPDTDCIFWENARSWLMTEESGGASLGMYVQGRRWAGPGSVRAPPWHGGWGRTARGGPSGLHRARPGPFLP